MAVSPAEARANLERRFAAQARQDQQAAVEAKGLLPLLVERLEQLGTKEIFLFGSLAEGRFRQHSDIDLATIGLDPNRIFGLMSELSELAHRRVDVVPLEDAPPSMVQRVREAGVRLK